MAHKTALVNGDVGVYFPREEDGVLWIRSMAKVNDISRSSREVCIGKRAVNGRSHSVLVACAATGISVVQRSVFWSPGSSPGRSRGDWPCGPPTRQWHCSRSSLCPEGCLWWQIMALPCTSIGPCHRSCPPLLITWGILPSPPVAACKVPYMQ